MCNFTPHRFTNWVCMPLSPQRTHQPRSKPLTNLPVCHTQTSSAQSVPTQLIHHSKCPSPTTGALKLCITATRTDEVCPLSAHELEPEQKRSGTCGACELSRVARDEKPAKAKIIGSEVGKEGEKKEGPKKEFKRSLPLKGKGRGPVRQSPRLRDRESEEPMKLTRR